MKQQVARSLAHYGLGKQLLQAIQDLDGDTLSMFIDNWWNDIIECLHRNPLGYISHPYPALADSLPPSFFDVKMAQRLI